MKRQVILCSIFFGGLLISFFSLISPNSGGGGMESGLMFFIITLALTLLIALFNVVKHRGKKAKELAAEIYLLVVSAPILLFIIWKVWISS